MSFTYSTLKTAIQDYLKYQKLRLQTNYQLLFKKLRIVYFHLFNYQNKEKNVQGTVTTGNRFLATPTDFYAPMSLAVISSDTYDYLDFKHPSFIKGIFVWYHKGQAEILLII